MKVIALGDTDNYHFVREGEPNVADKKQSEDLEGDLLLTMVEALTDMYACLAAFETDVPVKERKKRMSDLNDKLTEVVCGLKAYLESRAHRVQS
ncbi:MAG: hypothetical protein HY985_04050 [Magnetospirillum sp.]|nr:hypothetical protein [Magnetospirillum sp.]